MTAETELEQSYYWKLMRRAIDRIDSADGRSLALEDIAAEAGLSPAHFQRMFSRWAGVSPKRVQQYLTLDHATSLLEARHTSLETADAVGLSGGGRLHDLFVKWEAMSPGDVARKGAGLTISYAWVQSPFGRTLAMATERGLCGMAFAEETGDDATMADMCARWPNAHYVENHDALTPYLEDAFGSGAAKLHLIGAPFQIKVWEALMRIPTGHVTTYSDIAHAIGTPKAVRAGGTAVGRNPVSWIIPCHRALRKSGALGGYHWGLPVKRAMLAWEALETDTDRQSAA